MNKPLIIVIASLVIVGSGVAWQMSKREAPVIVNELEKADLIRLNAPRPNQEISSPLTITGEARGNWFFEASFPVVLTDWDGKIIAQGIATAQGEWMTSNFVPFEAKLTFTVDKSAYSNRGTLILRKDNPSGLSEYDDTLEVPVVLDGGTGNIPTSADNAPPGSIHNLPVPAAVSAVRTLVARELGISEGVVIVMTAYEREWPNGCLGLGGDKMCTQAIVPGYEVTVQAQGTERVYRTNADGSVIQREK